MRTGEGTLCSLFDGLVVCGDYKTSNRLIVAPRNRTSRRTVILVSLRAFGRLAKRLMLYRYTIIILGRRWVVGSGCIIIIVGIFYFDRFRKRRQWRYDTSRRIRGSRRCTRVPVGNAHSIIYLYFRYDILRILKES